MIMRTDISENLALAEASAWLVRLQGSGRTPASEAAFRAWLAEDPAHARAFSRVTDTWEIIPGAAWPQAAKAASRALRRPPWLAVAASVAFLCVVTLMSLRALGDTVYQTHVGEQQTVTLDDGSRITLNTNTRLSVDYSGTQRRIHLDRGEALFEVAKNPQRPFTVQAGDEQVRALGTTFMVRSEQQRLDVLLIEGSVRVSHVGDTGPAARDIAPVVLVPGERLALRDGVAERRLDRPPVEEMTAWRRGEAMFDNVTLAEAVAEINRYGKVQVRIEDPALAKLRISGVFATRDPAEFASVIAQLHDLDVVSTPGGVALKASPGRH